MTAPIATRRPIYYTHWGLLPQPEYNVQIPISYSPDALAGIESNTG